MKHTPFPEAVRGHVRWLLFLTLFLIGVASASAHYDPRLGRWLSRDPLGEEGGVNLYAYCGNDPVNKHDPTGLKIFGEYYGDVLAFRNYQLKTPLLASDPLFDAKLAEYNRLASRASKAHGAMRDITRAVDLFNGYAAAWENPLRLRPEEIDDESELGRSILFNLNISSVIKAEEILVSVLSLGLTSAPEATVGTAVRNLAPKTQVPVQYFGFGSHAEKLSASLVTIERMRAWVAGQGTLARGNINAAILGGIPDGFAGHHLIAISSAEKFNFMRRAELLGYNINRTSNGLALPRMVAESFEKGVPLHSGGHLRSYFQYVESRMEPYEQLYNAGLLPDEALMKAVNEIEDGIRSDLVTGTIRLQNAGWP